MRRLVVRKLAMLLLGAFVALGVGNANVASSDMANARLQPVSGMVDMPTVDCQDRSDTEPCKTAMTSCDLVCAGPILALPPQAALITKVPLPRDVDALDARLLVGISPPPDLSPPRSTDIV